MRNKGISHTWKKIGNKQQANKDYNFLAILVKAKR